MRAGGSDGSELRREKEAWRRAAGNIGGRWTELAIPGQCSPAGRRGQHAWRGSARLSEGLQAGSDEDAPDVGEKSLLATPAALAHRPAALESRDQTLGTGAKAVQLALHATITAGTVSVDAATAREGDALHAPSPTVRFRQKTQPNEVRAEGPLACRIAFHGRTSGQARTLVGNAEQAGARCLTLYGASVPGFYSRAQGR